MEKREGLRTKERGRTVESGCAGPEQHEKSRRESASGTARLNKGLLGSLTLAVAVALLFLAAASPGFLSAAALKNRKLPVYSVERDDKCVSLTFDAAWGNV